MEYQLQHHLKKKVRIIPDNIKVLSIKVLRKIAINFLFSEDSEFKCLLFAYDKNRNEV